MLIIKLISWEILSSTAFHKFSFVILSSTFQVIEELKALGRSDILVVCGGVIPPQHYQDLYDSGVQAVYGPGTSIPHAAIELVKAIESHLDGGSSKRASGKN